MSAAETPTATPRTLLLPNLLAREALRILSKSLEALSVCHYTDGVVPETHNAGYSRHSSPSLFSIADYQLLLDEFSRRHLAPYVSAIAHAVAKNADGNQVVFGRLPLPKSVDFAYECSLDNGPAIRLIRAYDINRDEYPLMIDVAYRIVKIEVRTR